MSNLIDRQDAIDALERKKDKTAKGEIGSFYNTIIQHDIDAIEQLPSAEPEIIYCKDCTRHNVSVEDYFDNNQLKVCPLVAYRGKAQGHEFDYQFCACAKRREDE